MSKLTSKLISSMKSDEGIYEEAHSSQTRKTILWIACYFSERPKKTSYFPISLTIYDLAKENRSLKTS